MKTTIVFLLLVLTFNYASFAQEGKVVISPNQYEGVWRGPELDCIGITLQGNYFRVVEDSCQDIPNRKVYIGKFIDGKVVIENYGGTKTTFTYNNSVLVQNPVFPGAKSPYILKKYIASGRKRRND